MTRYLATLLLLLSVVAAQGEEGGVRDRRSWVEAGFRATDTIIRTYRRVPQYAEHSERARAFIDRLVEVLDSFQVQHEWVADLDGHEVSQREGSRLMLTPGYAGLGEPGSDLQASSVFDPILINHRDFHRDQAPLDFVDLIKLIIHELGHKTGELDRGFRDRVGQDIADYIRPWLKKKELAPGVAVEALSIPPHFVQQWCAPTEGTQGQPTFWVFVHRPGGATDITPLLSASWERMRESVGGVWAFAYEMMFQVIRQIELVKPQILEDMKRKFRAAALAEIARRRIHMTPQEIAAADIQLDEQARNLSHQFRTDVRALHLLDFVEIKSAELEDGAYLVRLRGDYTLSRTDRDLIKLNDTSGPKQNMPWQDVQSSPVQMQFVVRPHELEPVRAEELYTLSFPVADYAGHAQLTAQRRGDQFTLLARLPSEFGTTVASFMIRLPGGYLISPPRLLRATENERGQSILELEWQVPAEYRESTTPMVVDSLLVDGHRMVYFKNAISISDKARPGYQPRGGIENGIVSGSLAVRMMRAVRGQRPEDFFNSEFNLFKPTMALEGSLFDVPSIDPALFTAGFRFRGNPADLIQVRLYMRRELFLARQLTEAEHREENGNVPRPPLDEVVFRSFVDGQFREFLKHGKAFDRREVPEILTFQGEQLTFRRVAEGEYFVQVQGRIPFRDPFPHKPPGAYLSPPGWSFFAFEAVEANGRTHVAPFNLSKDCELNFQGAPIDWDTHVTFNQ